ncbi:MAG TPA: hypothetical protein ENI87_02340, partial [bacterium]|nr:hypothetical protein [bacterium]
MLTPILALATDLTAQQLKGRKWTHDKFGVEMTIPQDFSVVPLQVDEKWIAAKFLCDKTYISKSRDWNHEHRPLMRIIIFTEEAKKDTGTEIHEEDGKTLIGIGAVPYQGYRDYVKRHRSGFFFNKENEARIGGKDCLMCEVEVHKSEPKLHLYSVVFRRPTFEFAVEFEVLEDRKDKLEAKLMKSLRSIRFDDSVVEASAPITGGGKGRKRTSSRLWTAFRDEWRKRPRAERDEIRRGMEQRHHEAVRKATPEDWTISESKHFLVVSHASAKFTKQMTDGAELFYKWCEKEFGDLGDDYVRRPVLRLCKDFDEYKAYHFDSSNETGWSLVGADREIGTYYDNYNGSSGRDVSLLFGGIMQHFLQERDPFIVSYTPYWLTWALDDYVRECYVKGRKLDFRVGDATRDEARNLLRDGKLPKLQELLSMNMSQLRDLLKKDRRMGYAASQALRYVIGPGSKDKAFKNFVKRYFETAIAVGEKYDAKWNKGQV